MFLNKPFTLPKSKLPRTCFLLRYSWRGTHRAREQKIPFIWNNIWEKCGMPIFEWHRSLWQIETKKEGEIISEIDDDFWVLHTIDFHGGCIHCKIHGAQKQVILQRFDFSINARYISGVCACIHESQNMAGNWVRDFAMAVDNLRLAGCKQM